MNSFETDLKRAVCNLNFIAGLLIECFILNHSGWNSQVFQISIPVLSALPYSTAWITDYQSGFITEYLPRCGRPAYILGKFLACGISGGALPTLAYLLYLHTAAGENASINPILLFLSGMFWAVVAATLAAASNSRYVAYGGAFVFFYILVILYERYFKALYCLYPVEWFMPTHTWVFEDVGIILMITGMILSMGFLYYEILRRCIEHA